MKDGCRGKVRHANQAAAVAAMIKIKNKGLTSYRCGVCGGWHVGNSRNPNRIAARIEQLLELAKGPRKQ